MNTFATVPLRAIGSTLFRLAVLALAPASLAQSYEGSGELSYSFFGLTNAHKESCRFEFRVDDRHWWIKTVPTSRAIHDYREASFDGTNVYLLESLESRVNKQPGESARVNVATAFLKQGSEILQDMHFDLDQIPAIWLTFCSGAFFKRQTDAMVEPVITFGRERDDYVPSKVRALWTLNADFPHTPKEVRYIADGWVPLADREPFQDGFTNVVFKADRFKTIDSLALPEIATIETFRPGVGPDDRQKLRMMSRYELKLLNARRSANSSQPFTPKIPGSTHVTDNRFHAKLGSLSYLITNSWTEAKRR